MFIASMIHSDMEFSAIFKCFFGSASTEVQLTTYFPQSSRWCWLLAAAAVVVCDRLNQKLEHIPASLDAVLLSEHESSPAQKQTTPFKPSMDYLQRRGIPPISGNATTGCV